MISLTFNYHLNQALDAEDEYKFLALILKEQKYRKIWQSIPEAIDNTVTALGFFRD